MEAWLKDLPMFYQPESTCALQNKAIAPHPTTPWTPTHDDVDDAAADDDSAANAHLSDDEDDTYSATVKARCRVRRLQRRAHVISTEFAQLCS